jgi:hypothetical protein
MAEIEKESYPEVSNHNLEATVNVDFTVVESTEVADAEIGKDYEKEKEIEPNKSPDGMDNNHVNENKLPEKVDLNTEEVSINEETNDLNTNHIVHTSFLGDGQKEDIEMEESSPKSDDNDGSHDNEHEAKRVRCGSVDEYNEHSLPGSQLDLESTDGIGFMESFLAVPLDCILRRTADNNRLLSSVEANLFLGITRIAYEMDALLEMSLQSIQKTKTCEHIAKNIEQSQNAFLYPMHSILHVHGILIPQKVLQTVQNELERILIHFSPMIQTLQQLAEQNWSVSNALTVMVQTNGDAFVNVLGKEKGNLAELEEELCRRLELVIHLCLDDETNNKGDVFDSFLQSQSMINYCEMLFSSRKKEGSEPYEASQRTHDAAVTLGLLFAASGDDNS